MKKFTSILFLLLFIASCNSPINNTDNRTEKTTSADSPQTSTGDPKLDSLLILTEQTPTDTALAMLYYDIAKMYELRDREKAKEYYLKLGILSEQLNWYQGRHLFTAGLSLLLSKEGLSDSAIVANLKKPELIEKKRGLYMQYISIGRSLGMIAMEREWFEQSVQHYSRTSGSLQRKFG
jgi:hypothetical protein